MHCAPADDGAWKESLTKVYPSSNVPYTHQNAADCDGGGPVHSLAKWPSPPHLKH